MPPREPPRSSWSTVPIRRICCRRSTSRNARPRKGEETRLDVAKRELIKALGGVKDGGQFNLIMYGNDVWSWDDEMVEMDPDVRGEIATFVQDLTAVGGTNIFRALQYAFEIAGVEDGGEWNEPAFDTIYLLTDGRPSVGAVTSATGILHFAREKNRSAGITIHTIGIGDDHDAEFLKELARIGNGKYVRN